MRVLRWLGARRRSRWNILHLGVVRVGGRSGSHFNFSNHCLLVLLYAAAIGNSGDNAKEEADTDDGTGSTTFRVSLRVRRDSELTDAEASLERSHYGCEAAHAVIISLIIRTVEDVGLRLSLRYESIVG